MVKTDCFAYNEKYGDNPERGCKALKIMECENCAFYKSKEELTQKKIRSDVILYEMHQGD